MDNKDLKRALTLVEDINLSNEEIDSITDKFLNILKEFNPELFNKYLNIIKEKSSSKEDMDIKEIFNLITNNLDENTLNNLIKVISDNDELVNYLQELLIDKII